MKEPYLLISIKL